MFLPISLYAALPSKRCTSKTGASIEPNRLFGLAKQTIWQGKTTRFISVLPARPKSIPCRRPQRAAQARQAAAIRRKLFAGPKEQTGQYPDYSVYDNNCTQRLQKKLIDEYYDDYGGGVEEYPIIEEGDYSYTAAGNSIKISASHSNNPVSIELTLSSDGSKLVFENNPYSEMVKGQALTKIK